MSLFAEIVDPLENLVQINQVTGGFMRIKKLRKSHHLVLLVYCSSGGTVVATVIVQQAEGLRMWTIDFPAMFFGRSAGLSTAASFLS